jgi:CBS domain containing-hemolysin-like protein
MFSQLILIGICVAANAFFEGIETGIISINRIRLRHHVEARDRWAVLLDDFLRHPDRLLATTLVGTNLTMIIASVEAASVGHSLLGVWGQVTLGAALTLVVLVFSEYLPKAWFLSQPMERCRPFVELLRLSERLLKPLARTVVWLTDWIVREPLASPSGRYPFITREELDVLAQEGEKHGVLSPRQRIMIRRVFELSAKTAAQLMLPRGKMVTVPAQATAREFLESAGKSGFTRFPIYDEDQRKFVGVVSLFDVLAAPAADGDVKIVRYMRPPLVIRDDTPLIEILPRLRLGRQPICLVGSATGEVVGLLTTQNVIAEIVGKQ